MPSAWRASSVSHGIYEIRTDPQDRGVLFTRGSQSAAKREISIAEILDDSVELNAKIKTMFDHLNRLDGIPFPAQMELSRLKASLCSRFTVESLDTQFACEVFFLPIFRRSRQSGIFFVKSLNNWCSVFYKSPYYRISYTN